MNADKSQAEQYFPECDCKPCLLAVMFPDQLILSGKILADIEAKRFVAVVIVK